MCQAGIVTSREDFNLFLKRDVAHSLTNVDLPLLAHAWRGEVDLAELDQLSWATRPTRQLRDAAEKIGRQQKRVFRETWNISIPNLPYTQSPVVTGALLKAAEVDLPSAAWSLAFQTYSALTQASLKLLPLGPRATQGLLTDALAAIAPRLEPALELPMEDIGSFNPVWDVAAAAHERAAARLFLS